MACRRQISQDRQQTVCLDPLYELAADTHLTDMFKLNKPFWENADSLRVYQAVTINALYDFGNDTPQVRDSLWGGCEKHQHTVPRR